MMEMSNKLRSFKEDVRARAGDEWANKVIYFKDLAVGDEFRTRPPCLMSKVYRKVNETQASLPEWEIPSNGIITFKQDAIVIRETV